jgi:hypothetical protein
MIKIKEKMSCNIQDPHWLKGFSSHNDWSGRIEMNF